MAGPNIRCNDLAKTSLFDPFGTIEATRRDQGFKNLLVLDTIVAGNGVTAPSILTRDISAMGGDLNIAVCGNLLIDAGDIDIYSNTNITLVAENVITLEANTIDINGNLSLCGETVQVTSLSACPNSSEILINTNLNVADSINVGDNLTVTNDVSIGGDLTVIGNVSGNNGVFTNLNVTQQSNLNVVVINTLTVTGNTTTDNLTVINNFTGNNANFSGNVTANNLTINNNLVANNGTFTNLNVTNNLVVTNIDADSYNLTMSNLTAGANGNFGVFANTDQGIYANTVGVDYRLRGVRSGRNTRVTPISGSTLQFSLTETNWRSVMDYGAVGDGVADDTAAIQAAINAVADLGGGKVFLPSLPDGTNQAIYRITSTLNLMTQVELEGVTHRSRVFIQTDTAGLVAISCAQIRAAIRRISFAVNPTVYLNRTAPYVVASGNGSGLTIEECTFQTGGVELDNVDTITIANCFFRPTNLPGIVHTSTTATMDFVVRDCFIHGVNGVPAATPELWSAVTVYSAGDSVYTAAGRAYVVTTGGSGGAVPTSEDWTQSFSYGGTSAFRFVSRIDVAGIEIVRSGSSPSSDDNLRNLRIENVDSFFGFNITARNARFINNSVQTYLNRVATSDGGFAAIRLFGYCADVTIDNCRIPAAPIAASGLVFDNDGDGTPGYMTRVKITGTVIDATLAAIRLNSLDNPFTRIVIDSCFLSANESGLTNTFGILLVGQGFLNFALSNNVIPGPFAADGSSIALVLTPAGSPPPFSNADRYAITGNTTFNGVLAVSLPPTQIVANNAE